MELYLPERAADAAAVLAMPGPKRIALVFMRDRGAQQFLSEIEDAMAANLPPEAHGALDGRMRQLTGLLLPNGEFARGTHLDFDSLPGDGTAISIGGRHLGAIDDPEFFPALLGAWLGPHPIQEDLKSRLLGGAH